MQVRTTVRKNRETGEWVVRLHVNGKHDPRANYFTDCKEDAYLSAEDMVKRVKERLERY